MSLLLTFLAACALSAPLPPPDSVVSRGSRSLDAVVVRSVTLRGNTRTNGRIIRREMALLPGDTINRADLGQKVAWDQRKITNTNLFITVEVATQEDTTAAPDYRPVDVVVTMKERWYIFVVPLFELADRNLNEWWYDRGHDIRRTNYGLQLSWKNFTGRNDKLTALAQTGFTDKYIFTYDRPYFDKAQRYGVNADFYYATNREIAYRTQADKWIYVRPDGLGSLRSRLTTSIGLTRRDGFYQFHELEARYSRNTIADTVAHLNPDYFLDGRRQQQFATLTYSYRYDRRDNVAYALRGTLFTGTLAHMGWLSNADLNQTELALGLSRYWPLSKRLFAASTIRLRSVWTDQQPYYGLRALGTGDDVMRGYELYVIEGQHFALFRNNIRYRLFSTVKQLNWLHVKQFNTLPISAYVSLIGDAGYVSSTVAERYQSRLANRWLYGYGASLDVVTFYNLVVRFSGVVNSQREPGFFLNIQREL